MTAEENHTPLSACFTGHRFLDEKTLPALTADLREVVTVLCEEGFCQFYTGGALGFDTLAAQVVLALRETQPSIRLTVVRPCADQAARWTPAARTVSEQILATADSVLTLAPTYYRGCMQARNRYLVEHSSLCVAYGRRSDSGTAQTVALAAARGLPIINLAEGKSQVGDLRFYRKGDTLL